MYAENTICTLIFIGVYTYFMDISFLADFVFLNLRMQDTVVFKYLQICHFLRHMAIFIDAL